MDTMRGGEHVSRADEGAAAEPVGAACALALVAQECHPREVTQLSINTSHDSAEGSIAEPALGRIRQRRQEVSRSLRSCSRLGWSWRGRWSRGGGGGGRGDWWWVRGYAGAGAADLRSISFKPAVCSPQQLHRVGVGPGLLQHVQVRLALVHTDAAAESTLYCLAALR